MPLPPIDTLVGPRVSVRAVAGHDLPDLLAINGDPEVTAFLPYATWLGLADGQAWLQRMQALCATGAAQQLVVTLNCTGRAVGTVLLFRFDAGSRRLEIGYALARAHWGQGVMHEALRCVCSQAFGPMGIRRIEAEVNPANRASNRLLQTLGFTLEGRLRQRWVAQGAAYDTHLYGCLADEWALKYPPQTD